MIICFPAGMCKPSFVRLPEIGSKVFLVAIVSSPSKTGVVSAVSVMLFVYYGIY